MNKLITIAAILSLSGTAYANDYSGIDGIDYVHLSFQWSEEGLTRNYSAGHPDVDYVHLSFQDDSQNLTSETALASVTGSQPDIGSSEIDYLYGNFDTY